MRAWTSGGAEPCITFKCTMRAPSLDFTSAAALASSARTRSSFTQHERRSSPASPVTCPASSPSRSSSRTTFSSRSCSHSALTNDEAISRISTRDSLEYHAAWGVQVRFGQPHSACSGPKGSPQCTSKLAAAGRVGRGGAGWGGVGRGGAGWGLGRV